MNILVCVKQVLNTEEIKPNHDKGQLDMEGVGRIVNPYDGYALETAARLKDKDSNAKIVVLTVGKEESVSALRDCLAVGADKAYMVSMDMENVSVGAVLAKAVRKIETVEGTFDLILCGKQAIDGDGAQTGPQLAQLIDRPQVTGGVEVSIDGNLIKVKKEAESGYVLLGAAAPCVVAMTQTFYEPRYPTIKSKMAAKKAPIEIYHLSDIGFDRTAPADASKLKILSSTLPPKRKAGQRIDEGSTADSACKLVELLSAAALI